MDRKSPISDASITRNVSRQLAGCGLRSPCRIEVQTRNGEVTLSGAVQFVHQRNAAVQAIRTVEGVRRVIEKLKVTPPAKHQYAQPAHAPKPAPPEPAETAAVAEAPSEAPEKSDALPPQPPAKVEPENSITDDSDDTSFDFDGPQPAAPQTMTDGMYHSRRGDSYTFECGSLEEAERLRAVLATYVDWLKKSSWVGEAKATGSMHHVTFHAKSIIEFLRQEGF